MSLDRLLEIQARLGDDECSAECLKEDLAWSVTEIVRLRKNLAVNKAVLTGTVLALNDALDAIPGRRDP